MEIKNVVQPPADTREPAESRRAQFVFDERSRIPVEQAIALGLPPALAGKPAEPTSKNFLEVQIGDELTGTADDSPSRGFIDAVIKVLGKPAEPVREWRVRTPSMLIGCFKSESECDDFIAGRYGSGPYKKQWRFAASEYVDADTSAAEGTK